MSGASSFPASSSPDPIRDGRLHALISRLFEPVESDKREGDVWTVSIRVPLVPLQLIGSVASACNKQDALLLAYRRICHRLCEICVLHVDLIEFVQQHGELAIHCVLPLIEAPLEHALEYIKTNKDMPTLMRISKEAFDMDRHPQERASFDAKMREELNGLWDDTILTIPQHLMPPTGQFGCFRCEVEESGAQPVDKVAEFELVAPSSSKIVKQEPADTVETGEDISSSLLKLIKKEPMGEGIREKEQIEQVSVEQLEQPVEQENNMPGPSQVVDAVPPSPSPPSHDTVPSSSAVPPPTLTQLRIYRDFLDEVADWVQTDSTLITDQAGRLVFAGLSGALLCGEPLQENHSQNAPLEVDSEYRVLYPAVGLVRALLEWDAINEDMVEYILGESGEKQHYAVNIRIHKLAATAVRYAKNYANRNTGTHISFTCRDCLCLDVTRSSLCVEMRSQCAAFRAGKGGAMMLPRRAIPPSRTLFGLRCESDLESDEEEAEDDKEEDVDELTPEDKENQDDTLREEPPVIEDEEKESVQMEKDQEQIVTSPHDESVHIPQGHADGNVANTHEGNVAADSLNIDERVEEEASEAKDEKPLSGDQNQTSSQSTDSDDVIWEVDSKWEQTEEREKEPREAEQPSPTVVISHNVTASPAPMESDDAFVPTMSITVSGSERRVEAAPSRKRAFSGEIWSRVTHPGMEHRMGNEAKHARTKSGNEEQEILQDRGRQLSGTETSEITKTDVPILETEQQAARQSYERSIDGNSASKERELTRSRSREDDRRSREKESRRGQEPSEFRTLVDQVCESIGSLVVEDEENGTATITQIPEDLLTADRSRGDLFEQLFSGLCSLWVCTSLFRCCRSRDRAEIIHRMKLHWPIVQPLFAKYSDVSKSSHRKELLSEIGVVGEVFWREPPTHIGIVECARSVDVASVSDEELCEWLLCRLADEACTAVLRERQPGRRTATIVRFRALAGSLCQGYWKDVGTGSGFVSGPCTLMVQMLSYRRILPPPHEVLYIARGEHSEWLLPELIRVAGEVLYRACGEFLLNVSRYSVTGKASRDECRRTFTEFCARLWKKRSLRAKQAVTLQFSLSVSVVREDGEPAWKRGARQVPRNYRPERRRETTGGGRSRSRDTEVDEDREKREGMLAVDVSEEEERELSEENDEEDEKMEEAGDEFELADEQLEEDDEAVDTSTDASSERATPIEDRDSRMFKESPARDSQRAKKLVHSWSDAIGRRVEFDVEKGFLVVEGVDVGWLNGIGFRRWVNLLKRLAQLGLVPPSISRDRYIDSLEEHSVQMRSAFILCDEIWTQQPADRTIDYKRAIERVKDTCALVWGCDVDGLREVRGVEETQPEEDTGREERCCELLRRVAEAADSRLVRVEYEGGRRELLLRGFPPAVLRSTGDSLGDRLAMRMCTTLADMAVLPPYTETVRMIDERWADSIDSLVEFGKVQMLRVRQTLNECFGGSDVPSDPFHYRIRSAVHKIRDRCATTRFSITSPTGETIWKTRNLQKKSCDGGGRVRGDRDSRGDSPPRKRRF